MNRNNDKLVDIQTLLTTINDAQRPLLSKLEKIEDKLSGSVTKDDMNTFRTEVFQKIETLEKNMSANYVQRDVYETRHQQLIQRDAQLEQMLRDAMTNAVAWQARIEQTVELAKKDLNERMDKEKMSELSDGDRRRLIFFQWVSGISSVICVLSVVLGHVKFS
jgi:hypothetical protein